MLRGAGIVALFVLAACNQSSPTPRVSPSVPAVQATWTQDLTFSGELTGHMTTIVPNTAAMTSACTRVDAVRAWLDFMVSNDAEAAKRRQGMEPA